MRNFKNIKIFQARGWWAAFLAAILAFGLGAAFLQWVLPPPRVVLPLPAPTSDGGYGWVVNLPKLAGPFWQRALYGIPPGGDAVNRVTVLEDGLPLPEPNSSTEAIRDQGRGRYARRGDALCFSATQNDDPTNNGREYMLEIQTQPRMRILAVVVLSALGGSALALHFFPCLAAAFWGALRRLNCHAVVIILFALFSILVYIGRTGGAPPNITLGGDAGMVCAKAAALDNPEAFRRDPVYSHPDWLEYYQAFHVPWLRLARPWFDSYARAYVGLLLPCVFLHLTGYYLLGLALGWSRLWSAAFSIVMLVTFWVDPFGTYWGFYPDPQPSFLFAALAGFLFAAAVHWRERPWCWALIMAAAGLAMNFHMVSGPTVAMMLWLGFLLSASGFSPWRHLGYLLGLGFLFLAISLPGILLYGGSGGYVNHPDPEIRRLLILGIYENYTNVPVGAARFFKDALGRSGLVLVALAGILAVWKLGGTKEKTKLRLGLGWGGGIIFAAFLVPLLDMGLAAALERGPLLMDLIRGLRFFVFLSVLAAIWGAHEASVFLQGRYGRAWPFRLAAPLALAVILAACYSRQVEVHIPKPWFLAWAAPGLVLKGPAPASPMAELLEAAKRLPAGTLILPLGANGLSLRHAALRPVAATPKDIIFLGASKGGELREFFLLAIKAAGVDPAYAYYREIAAKHGWPDPPRPASDEERLAEARQLGEITGAEVYALGKNALLPFSIKDLGVTLWENEEFALVARKRND